MSKNIFIIILIAVVSGIGFMSKSELDKRRDAMKTKLDGRVAEFGVIKERLGQKVKEMLGEKEQPHHHHRPGKPEKEAIQGLERQLYRIADRLEDEAEGFGQPVREHIDRFSERVVQEGGKDAVFRTQPVNDQDEKEQTASDDVIRQCLSSLVDVRAGQVSRHWRAVTHFRRGPASRWSGRWSPTAYQHHRQPEWTYRSWQSLESIRPALYAEIRRAND